MTDFNVQKFTDAILREKVFSVPLNSKKGIEKVQNKDFLEKPLSKGGRIWKNIIDSLASKVYRAKASAEVRKSLVGSKEGKITNKNIVKYLKVNLNQITKKDELIQLKTALIALEGFGADQKQISEIKTVIDEKLIDIYAEEEMQAAKSERRNERTLAGRKKDKNDIPTAEKSMKVNLKKAVHEHLLGCTTRGREAYVTSEELAAIQSSESIPEALRFKYSCGSDIGIRRPSNEDAEFVLGVRLKGDEADIGIVAGVLDGHGGGSTAKYLKGAFTPIFQYYLKESDGNALRAFEKTYARLQEELKRAGYTDGSTAVISYVDTKTNIVRTATLGDSEAMVLRKINGKWKLIPLSPVRDWGTDAERTEGSKLLVNNEMRGLQFISPSQVKEKIKLKWMQPKDVRVVGQQYGSTTNVSRSFGDVQFSHDGKGVIQKPKVSSFQLEPGDRFFLACDGIFDYLEPEEIVALVKDDQEPGDFINALIENAKANMVAFGRGDNVTVVAFNMSLAT